MRVKDNLPPEVIARFQPPEVTLEQWRKLPAWQGLDVVRLCLGGQNPQKAGSERSRAANWLCSAVTGGVLEMQNPYKGAVNGLWPHGVFKPTAITQWAAPLFDAFPFEPDPEPIKADITESERESLLKIIFGMALDKYGYTPGARNRATGENTPSIHAALQRHGLSVDSDTIRKYLQEAAERNPGAT